MRQAVSLVALILWAGLIMAANTSQQVITLTPSQKQFVVILPVNPTTGYQLKLTTYEKKLFRLIKQRYVGPNSTRVGAGGHMEFTFQCLANNLSKESFILFTLARPWDATTVQPISVLIRFSPNLHRA